VPRKRSRAEKVLPSRVLRAAGFGAEAIDVITAEVASLPADVLGRDDLWAEAIAAAWLMIIRRPEVGPAYLRIRVRGALRDAIRRELRERGQMNRTFYWPWFRPIGAEARCACGTVIASPYAHKCSDCRQPEASRRTRGQVRLIGACVDCDAAVMSTREVRCAACRRLRAREYVRSFRARARAV